MPATTCSDKEYLPNEQKKKKQMLHPFRTNGHTILKLPLFNTASYNLTALCSMRARLMGLLTAFSFHTARHHFRTSITSHLWCATCTFEWFNSLCFNCLCTLQSSMYHHARNLSSTCNIYRTLASFLATHNIQFHTNIVNWFTFSC
jgi:hypothetical protein